MSDDIKTIDANLNEVLKQLSYMSDDIKDTNGVIIHKQKEVCFRSYIFGINLGLIEITNIEASVISTINRIIDDLSIASRGLDLGVSRELEKILRLEQKIDESGIDKEDIWKQKMQITNRIQGIAGLSLERHYGTRCSNYMHLGVVMGILRMWSLEEGSEYFEAGIATIEGCITLSRQANIPEKYIFKLENIRKKLESGENVEDPPEYVGKTIEEIGKYIGGF